MSTDQASPEPDRPPLVKATELLASINPTVAPIQYFDESGKLVGLDVDFGNMIAAWARWTRRSPPTLVRRW